MDDASRFTARRIEPQDGREWAGVERELPADLRDAKISWRHMPLKLDNLVRYVFDARGDMVDDEVTDPLLSASPDEGGDSI